MNKVILLGRLTKDCNTKYTQTGKCVTTFTLAVNRPTTKDGEQQADFVPVVLWGKVAETVGNYVHKGQRLLVEGRLQVRTFEANDGSKRWVNSLKRKKTSADLAVTNTQERLLMKKYHFKYKEM